MRSCNNSVEAERHHMWMLLWSVGVLDVFIQIHPSSTFEVNCNKLHWITLSCIALRQAWIEPYQTSCLKYIIGALNYWVYIEAHIESVRGGEIRSPGRELACGPESHPDMWMVLMKMKMFPVAPLLLKSCYKKKKRKKKLSPPQEISKFGRSKGSQIIDGCIHFPGKELMKK